MEALRRLSWIPNPNNPWNNNCCACPTSGSPFGLNLGPVVGRPYFIEDEKATA